MIKIITKFNIKNVLKIPFCLKNTLAGNKAVLCQGNLLKFETKVPQSYVKDTTPELTKIKIDEDTIQLLEYLSLVDCANKQGIATLEDAILFADKILHINTDNVEPMYTVLEDRHLTLRDDEISDGGIQKDILKNAAVTEEDYFVAPPGNIPLQPRSNLLHKEETDLK